MRFGVRFDTKQQTGGSGEEPPVSSILESNSAKLRAKNSVLQSKMNNLCQISRQIFRRSFSRNSARYKTFMFLCQAPRLCQIDRLPCDIAAMLGVKQSSISDAKRRNHIPDSWILTLFNKKGLNPSWIRTGEGPQYVAGTDTPPTPVLSEQQAAESLEPILRAALLGVVPELAD